VNIRRKEGEKERESEEEMQKIYSYCSRCIYKVLSKEDTAFNHFVLKQVLSLHHESYKTAALLSAALKRSLFFNNASSCVCGLKSGFNKSIV
jgi:hypothetical protein